MAPRTLIFSCRTPGGWACGDLEFTTAASTTAPRFTGTELPVPLPLPLRVACQEPKHRVRKQTTSGAPGQHATERRAA
jgi:hypothetical protein